MLTSSNNHSLLLATAMLFALSSCVRAPEQGDAGPDDVTPDMSSPTMRLDASTNDAGTQDLGAPSDTTYQYVLIEDATPVGQGLPLDAVELCNQLGQSCAPMTQVIASSDEMIDYTGATNGANAQDDSCDISSFTRMGGTPNWVILGFADADARVGSQQKLNVWTGDSQCSLVEMGDKAFDVRLGNSADPTSFDALDSCLGTCTIDLP